MMDNNDLLLIRKYVNKDKQEDALEKLNSGYPIQYIIGNVEFYNSIINVNENVLIPRFETEYLVEKTISYIKKFNFKKPKILEIGAGSGCISIALKKELDCTIKAIDISKKALETAVANAKLNNVEIDFKVCDINNFNDSNIYDVIISNPPYVPFNSIVDEKIKYEPQNAIYADENGVYFYRVILEKIKSNLNENYLIAFEIGDNEGNLIKKIVENNLPNSYIKIEKDYNNFERYVFISNKKEILN